MAEPLPDHQSVPQSAVSLLVVDDEPDMRILVRAFLERAGYRVVGEAANGPDALLEFRRLNPPPEPTVIILDNRMPTLTGLQVAEQVLAERPDQLIVLFTAYLDDDVRAAATRLGVAACLSKTRMEQLPEVVRELTSTAC